MKTNFLFVLLFVVFIACTKEKVTLKEVVISKNPDKLSYYIGEELSLDGIEIKKVYSDGNYVFVKLSHNDFIGFDSSKANDKLFVYAIVDGKKIGFSVNIIKAVLISAEIKSLPNKLKYTIGEKIDLSGLELIGKYSDGKLKPIIIGDKDIVGFNSEKPMENQKLDIIISDSKLHFNISILPIRVSDNTIVEFIGEASEFIFPDNIISIGDNVFKDKKIDKIVLNEGLESIGKHAFYSCSLNSINFPSTLKSIGDGAFYYCKNLKEADLSSTKLLKIAEDAFAKSEKLEVLKLPESLESIEEQAFIFTGSISELVIPANVSVIKRWAFKESGIKVLKIHNRLKNLEKYSFYHCKSLQKVSVYGELTSDDNIEGKLGISSFEGCSELAHFEIPSSVTHLGQSLLTGTKVKELKLSSRIKHISFSAFKYSNLKEAYIDASHPPKCELVADRVWYGFPKKVDFIKVPSKAVDEYRKAKGWSEFSEKIIAQ